MPQRVVVVIEAHNNHQAKANQEQRHTNLLENANPTV
jgi:hypothetical protein